MRKNLLLTLVVGLCLVLPLTARAQTPASAPAGTAEVVAQPAKPVAGDVSVQPAKPVSGDADKTKDATSKPVEGEATTQGTKTPSIWDNSMLYVMIGGMVLLWVWMGRSKKKQAKKRQELLSSLKKGDKITTIGGIIGTVIEVRDNEVTVKTDETNNVRMKFARWAIGNVGEPTKGDQKQS